MRNNGFSFLAPLTYALIIEELRPEDTPRRPSRRNSARAARTKRTGQVLNDDRADWREAWARFPGDVVCVWHGALHATTVADCLARAGFAIRSQIIWARDRLVLGRGDDQWRNGAFLALAKLAIDTGYKSASVSAWSRKQRIAQVAPVKGLEGCNRVPPV